MCEVSFYAPAPAGEDTEDAETKERLVSDVKGIGAQSPRAPTPIEVAH